MCSRAYLHLHLSIVLDIHALAQNTMDPLPHPSSHTSIPANNTLLPLALPVFDLPYLPLILRIHLLLLLALYRRKQVLERSEHVLESQNLDLLLQEDGDALVDFGERERGGGRGEQVLVGRGVAVVCSEVRGGEHCVVGEQRSRQQRARACA
jgi:hypothetical protein